MRCTLLLLAGVRRWLFLPALVTTVPMLVLIKGGDVSLFQSRPIHRQTAKIAATVDAEANVGAVSLQALSVCFNSVAVLFLCEIE
jgi:hypothetical protein